jgi:hypothetical protein
MKVRGLTVGQAFGVGLVSTAALACSGDVFRATHQVASSEEGGSGGGDNSGGSSSIVPRDRSSTPDRPLGGAAGKAATSDAGTAGEIRGGSAGTAATAGAGGTTIEPPGEGMAGTAGQPNVDPNCVTPIVEDWSAALGSGGPWDIGFGDPRVDTLNHRLVLSYDDVVQRNDAYEGGYYISAEVTIEGGTVFTPYPYTFEVLLPSLRRTASGSSIELGATQYGPSAWSANDWPGFSGATLPGGKLTVRTYVKATSKALAVTVTDGKKVYKSGWVTDFHWPMTNLGVLRFVGENNSGVAGGSDLIYVSAAVGCQRLSDAAVDAAFKK